MTVTLPYPLTPQRWNAVYEAVTDDHPAWFFLPPVYDTTQKNGKVTAVTVTFWVADRVSAQQELQAVTEEFRALTAHLTDEYEIERVLHDALARRCEYGEDGAASLTAYGALVNGKAVCEGYARAMQYLLNAVGIDAVVLYGYDKNGEYHAWNGVCLDGQWYHLDPTENDNTSVVHHAYFNLTTDQLVATHLWEEEEPVCTATQDNFFVRNGGVIANMDLKSVAKETARQLERGDTAELCWYTEEAFVYGKNFVDSGAWFVQTVNAYLTDETKFLTEYRVFYDTLRRTALICKISE